MSKKKKLMIAGGGVGAVIVLFLVLIFTHVICINHVYVEATCTKPKTCKYCGREDGEPLGHKFSEATCTKPKTCNNCGITEGKTLEHEWQDATCTEPQKCSKCDTTQGEPLGHDWEEATCDYPKTCAECGEEEGEPLGHKEGKWKVKKKSSLIEHGKKERKCKVCGEVTDDKEIPIILLKGKNGKFNATVLDVLESMIKIFNEKTSNADITMSIESTEVMGDDNGYAWYIYVDGIRTNAIVYIGGKSLTSYCYEVSFLTTKASDMTTAFTAAAAWASNFCFYSQGEEIIEKICAFKSMKHDGYIMDSRYEDGLPYVTIYPID